jgi:hypothetical protein
LFTRVELIASCLLPPEVAWSTQSLLYPVYARFLRASLAIAFPLVLYSWGPVSRQRRCVQQCAAFRCQCRISVPCSASHRVGRYDAQPCVTPDSATCIQTLHRNQYSQSDRRLGIVFSPTDRVCFLTDAKIVRLGSIVLERDLVVLLT